MKLCFSSMTRMAFASLRPNTCGSLATGFSRHQTASPHCVMLNTITRLDLLVTDVGLPNGMNGRQVAEAVRQHRPGVPVLFITGYSGTTLGQGTEVVRKPFNLDTLARRIQSLLSASGAASEAQPQPASRRAVAGRAQRRSSNRHLAAFHRSGRDVSPRRQNVIAEAENAAKESPVWIYIVAMDGPGDPEIATGDVCSLLRWHLVADARAAAANAIPTTK